MPTTWEENSQLILTELKKLGQHDEKIFGELAKLGLGVQRSKTISTLLGSLLIIVVPIMAVLTTNFVDTRDTVLFSNEKKISKLESKLASSIAEHVLEHRLMSKNLNQMP